MEQSKFQTIVLTASEGMYITQTADVEILNRIVAETVALGKNDSANNYKEITKEEGNAIREEQEKLIQKQINEISRV